MTNGVLLVSYLHNAYSSNVTSNSIAIKGVEVIINSNSTIGSRLPIETKVSSNGGDNQTT